MTHNQIIEQAVDYLERLAAVAPDSTRYTVHYAGFGEGGTSGVTKSGAMDYLYRLREQAARDYRRYQTRMEYVTITADVPAAKFAVN